jgi:hypothetical protein
MVSMKFPDVIVDAIEALSDERNRDIVLAFLDLEQEHQNITESMIISYLSKRHPGKSCKNIRAYLSELMKGSLLNNYYTGCFLDDKHEYYELTSFGRRLIKKMFESLLP